MTSDATAINLIRQYTRQGRGKDLELLLKEEQFLAESEPQAPARINTDEVVSKFVASKRYSVSEASLATYKNILGTFNKQFASLPTTPEPIEEYLAARPSPRSRQLLYSCLNSLYEFANKRLGAPQVMNLITRPRGKSKESDYLSLAQLKALGDVIETDRDMALFRLYAGQGFRRIEATRVNIGDIFDNKIRVRGKEKEEYLPLLPEVKDVMLELTDGRGVKEPVFVSQRKARLGPDMAAEYIGRLFKRANITGMHPSPHTLRHTFCTQMLAAGCDRTSVEALMRHRTENVTDIYSHLSTEQRLKLLRGKLEQYSPIRLIGSKPQNIPINPLFIGMLPDSASLAEALSNSYDTAQLRIEGKLDLILHLLTGNGHKPEQDKELLEQLTK